jgi:hypothetical protein
MSAINWLFAVPEEPRPWWKIIIWWEVRRIPYNLIVGSVGFISLLLFFLFINLAHELKPGEDAVEPMALFINEIYQVYHRTVPFGNCGLRGFHYLS